MMSEIRLSIIIPIYNMEKYLHMCLDSVMEQITEDMEVILIDDGSTDSSIDIIREYQKNYPDNIVIITKENGGQGSARNLGIEKSKGQYIGFVDADDYVEPGMFEEMCSLAYEKNLDYVECDYRFLEIQNDKEIDISKYGVVKKRNHKLEFFKDPLVSPWNKIYRGDILRDNHITFPEGVIYEDTSFYIKAIPFIHTFDYIDKPYVKHFLRQGSTMTGSKSIRVGNIFPVLQDAIDFYNKNGFITEYRDEMEYFCVKILLCSSVDRISSIVEKDLKMKFVDETWAFIKKNFPDYKSNPYMKGGKKNLYMKNINKPLMKILLPFIKK